MSHSEVNGSGTTISNRFETLRNKLGSGSKPKIRYTSISVMSLFGINLYKMGEAGDNNMTPTRVLLVLSTFGKQPIGAVSYL